MEATNNNACPICDKDKGENKWTCSHKCYSMLTRNTKICVVCGDEYFGSFASKRRTCSDKCKIALRKQIAKELHAEGLRKLQAESPVAQKGEINPHSKKWVIKSPDGIVYECRNLLHFFRENSDLIDGTPLNAFGGISKIKRSMQGRTGKRNHTHWKGWTLIEWGD